MLAHQLVALEELVDGEVGLHTGNVVERFDPVVVERHHALVGGVVGALQADHLGAPRRRGPAAVEAASSAFVGSTSSMEAIRQPSPTPCSRLRIAATAVNSSADNGSNG